MFTDPDHYKFKIGMYYSKDAGRTWHDTDVLPGFQDYSLTSDISIDFSATGIAYACVLATKDDGTSGIFVSSSKDGGKTWSNPSTVFLDTTGATFSDKPWIVVDRSTGPYRGSIYVAWNLDDNRADNALDPDAREGDADRFASHQAAPNAATGLVVSHSTDGGQTWSQPLTLVPFDAYSQQFALGAIPQVDPKGRLRIAYLKWNQASSGVMNTIEVATSTDGGNTFAAPRTAARIQGLPDKLKNGTFRNLSLPTFAVSPKDGSMAVAWGDVRNGDADILLTRSSDGTKWSGPYRVNHDHQGNGADQFQPELAVAPNGVYTCAWFDRRHDKTHTLIDEEIAQSSDGAKTFGRNFRVTTRSWDPSIDAPRPSDGNNKTTFIGDYQGLTADNNAVHPLWNDTQNGKTQEIRTAVIKVTLFSRRP